MRDRLVVDRDRLVGAVLEHDLRVLRVLLLRRLGLERQVDVDALLGERQRRHEDDEEHEQHVDERRDVHVRAGVRDFPADDLFGAEMLVGVQHYWPPPAVCPGTFFFSVIRRDVLDLRLAQRVHGIHDGAVLGVLVALEIDDLLFLVLERGRHAARRDRPS